MYIAINYLTNYIFFYSWNLFFDYDTIIIAAKEGDDDKVKSGLAIDQLYGDDGKDALHGHADNNRFFGQAGSDNLIWI